VRKLIFSIAGLWALAVPSFAAAVEPTVLKLEPFRKSVALKVEVGGKQRLFQLDTGGGISFISPELAKSLGCEKGLRVSGFRMTGEKLDAPRCDDVALKIGGREFKVPVAGVYQVGEFNAKGVTVDGLLALDAFAGQTITLDSAGLRLIVETPESARQAINGATELPALTVREIGGHGLAVDVQVPTSAGPLGFQIDSGNGGTILVAKDYAKLFGIDPDKGPQKGSIPVGQGIEANGLIFPAGITIDGNLGMPFLKNYRVTIDLARGRLWLKPNPTPPPAGMGVPPEMPPPSVKR
jgi:hypothetical protein